MQGQCWGTTSKKEEEDQTLMMAEFERLPMRRSKYNIIFYDASLKHFLLHSVELGEKKEKVHTHGEDLENLS